MQNISEVMSDRHVFTGEYFMAVSIFLGIFFFIFHFVRVYLFMRYISPPNGLHGEYL